MIRIDALWLATEPLDMRAGTESALARVVAVFGAARPHHAYLFANRRANRMKVLVHDGIGVWLAARRLNSGRFVWPRDGIASAARSYLWAYATGAFENTKVVVYDFCESRSGEHARRFLGDWRGSLTCDDFSGYKALIASGVTEVGCLAHARRKFFDLHAANQSQIAEFALQQFARVYEIEREVKALATDQRQAIRQQQTKPLLDALHQWMLLQRQKVPEGSASAKALDYSLRRWDALTRFAGNGQLPVDNNWIENQIRPIAIGRNNWLFAGSLRAGQRAAAVMSLIQSARMNGHDPYAYLRDVMARLPMQRASQIGELLPHRWQPA